jgi:hypothetical protein
MVYRRQNVKQVRSCRTCRAQRAKDVTLQKVAMCFLVVQAAQYRRLEAIKSPLWVGAMALLINSKKSKWFRWHDSGDIQDVDHLLKIFAVCKLTPETRHWLPTREAWTKDFLDQVPGNLTLRFSMPMIDQPAAGSWVNTSTVVSGQGRTCPAPDQSNECKDCRACWDSSVRKRSLW